MTTKRRRRRSRRRVFVDLETCETAGDMEANLPVVTPKPGESSPPSLPYGTWGLSSALTGLLVAIGIQLVVGSVFVLLTGTPDEELSTTASVALQIVGALTFIAVPLVIVSSDQVPWRLALQQLGLRRFRFSALGYMAAAVGAYLVLVSIYVALVGVPEQDDIAESFGSLPFQILLIAIAAPISEEIFFRGMLYGGMRRRMRPLAAALLSALIFGSLHAFTGLSAVPPLIVFGFVIALLYEKTGSVVPCILLHMLNNSIALLTQ